MRSATFETGFGLVSKVTNLMSDSSQQLDLELESWLEHLILSVTDLISSEHTTS
jgi:hypothetical protein